MAFFKDKPALIAAALAPAKSYTSPLPPANAVLGRLTRTYNTLGGLIDTLADQSGIDPVAVLAVWYVESGGRSFTPGKPVIRFENHKFFQFWGHDPADAFDQHFCGWYRQPRRGVPLDERWRSADHGVQSRCLRIPVRDRAVRRLRQRPALACARLLRFRAVEQPARRASRSGMGEVRRALQRRRSEPMES